MMLSLSREGAHLTAANISVRFSGAAPTPRLQRPDLPRIRGAQPTNTHLGHYQLWGLLPSSGMLIPPQPADHAAVSQAT
jgi:hypothetical protein